MFVAVLILLFACLAPLFAQDSDYTLEARPTSGIRIDGRLDSEWNGADVAKNFVQREPGYPAPSTQPSEVRVLFDNDALYVGYMLYDSAPDSVKGQIQRRDNDGSSDFVDLYLDTFHDGRNGYWFTLTAAGVQAEGNFFNEQELSASWDAVWQSAVAITDSGWSCELRIPFHILRHAGARDDGWGIAFARKILRKNEAGFWPPVNPEIGWKASNLGTLVGLKDIASSSHVEILPHAVGRWDAPSEEVWASKNEWENLGVSVKLVPTADLTVDLAYQPDFAQVDVDDEVINLNDYPVYLEEKRPFFLESNELFAETAYRMFYSRRVTDPDYGGRLNFQKGKVRATLLAGKNRSQEDEEGNYDLQNVSAGRVTYNLGGRHRIGTTYTYLGQDGYHAATGAIDARLRWRERDRLQLWLAAVDRKDDAGAIEDEQPVEAKVGYLRDYWPVRAEVAVLYRGTDYNVNDMGFGDFSNVLRKAVWIGNNYYHQSGLFRNNGFDINAIHTTHTDGTHADGYVSFNSFNTFRNSWEVGAGSEFGDNWRRNYWADSTWDRDNFGSFAPEYYKYFYHWFWAYTDFNRPIRGGFETNYRSFRDGKTFGLDPTTTWRPRSNAEIGLKFTWRQIWDAADYGDSTVNIRYWTLKATWTPHLNLSFRGTFIYADQEWFQQDEQKLYANLLLSYNWQPGSWFYLVYDEAYRDTDPLAESRPGDRTLRAKLTYFFVAP
ncbi:carbohydrate binding family 9 domain-containing protein [bacterium]|nr:carbohydrate binding family 9 domain-containing protein [bacterium]